MTESKGSTSYVVLVSLVVALGGFLMGFDSGVIGGVNEPVREYFALSSVELGWVVSCLTLAATIAMGVAGPLADRFGRKPVLMTTALLFSISAIGSAIAPSYTTLVIARFIGGFGVGAALIIAPMYIAEIAPPDKRGRLVSFNQLNIVLGFSASFFSNYFINDGAAANAGGEGWMTPESSWRLMLGVETVPAVLYFFLLLLVPRSPRWLATQNRDEEALTVLARANGQAVAATELQGIRENLAKAAGEARAKLSDLFNSRMGRIMTIGLGLGFFQQITGINAIFYYAPTIFEMSGASRDSSLFMAIVVGLVNIAFTVLAMWMIDRAGRRPLLLAGTSLMAIALFTNTAAFGGATYEVTAEAPAQLAESIRTGLMKDLSLEMSDEEANQIATTAAAEAQVAYASLQGQIFESQIDFANAIKAAAEPLSERARDSLVGKIQDLAKGALELNGMLVLIAICAFIAGFGISLGPVMWAMFSEIFPMHVRGLAISVAGFFNSAISYLVQQLFPVGMDTVGPAIVFGFFGTLSVAAFLFSMFIIPETKGRTLEELEEVLVRN